MTLEKFNEECINKGKTIANVDKKNSSNQKINNIMVIDYAAALSLCLYKDSFFLNKE
jgi:hypothetical protein